MTRSPTTRASYYETNRFADVFATVTRAPNGLTDEIARIDGVAAVETRISKIALADVEGMSEPGSVLLVSLPDYHDPVLNQIHLRSGRLPDPAGRRRSRGQRRLCQGAWPDAGRFASVC